MAKNKFRKPVKQLPKQPNAAPAAAQADATQQPAPNAAATGGATASNAGASKQPIAPSGDAVDSNDPTIAKVQDAVRDKIPPQYRVAVQRIVLAGMKVMFSPETHHLMLQALNSDTDPAHAVGMGVTQLLTLLFKESKGTMPIPAIIPAGILLCCEALDFMEKANMVQVTTDLIDNTVQTITAYMMQKLGFTPQKLAQIAQRGGAGGGAQQPAPAGAQQPPGAAPGAGAAPTPPQSSAAPSPGLIGQQMGAQ